MDFKSRDSMDHVNRYLLRLKRESKSIELSNFPSHMDTRTSEEQVSQCGSDTPVLLRSRWRRGYRNFQGDTVMPWKRYWNFPCCRVQMQGITQDHVILLWLVFLIPLCWLGAQKSMCMPPRASLLLESGCRASRGPRAEGATGLCMSSHSPRTPTDHQAGGHSRPCYFMFIYSSFL